MYKCSYDGEKTSLDKNSRYLKSIYNYLDLFFLSHEGFFFPYVHLKLKKSSERRVMIRDFWKYEMIA